jgi:hypothetical protein
MGGLHAAATPLIALPLVVLAAASLASALSGRGAAWVERTRLLALGLLVAESALGLALAVRGAGPAEWLHWAYAIAAGLALLLPGMLAGERSVARRATITGIAAVLALAMSWRLAATG